MSYVLSKGFKLEALCDLKATFRSLGFVIPSLAFPCVFYVFFGVLMAKGNTSSYLLVNYMIFGIMGPALFNFGINVATDRENGWLCLKRLSPMPAIHYIFAKTLTALCFSTLIFILLSVIAITLASVSLSAAQWISLYGLSLLGTLPFCMLGLLLGLTCTAKGAPAIVNLVYLPMAMLSGLWLPITMLPEVIQYAAWVLPSYHLSQLGLSIIDQGQGFSVGVHIAAVVAFSIPCAYLALKKYLHTQTT
jgi:ABC-2 type transport system permease protein